MRHPYRRISLETQADRDRLNQEAIITRETGLPTAALCTLLQALIQRMLLAPNFRSYPSREDLEGDALVACIKAAVHNYDPALARTAHSYFYRVAWFAFIGRIKKIKKAENTLVRARECLTYHRGNL